MPYSTGFMKNEIKQHFIKNIPTTTSILDAGAGCGTYSNLLKAEFPKMDGIEIFPNYIEMFELRGKYNNLYIQDVLNFNISSYEYIILGDIIEHISVENAQSFLNKINESGKKCLVAVPYLFEQGVHFENQHEIHLQSDLTEALFLERYPHMNLLFGNHEYGYFVNYDYE